VVILFGFSHAWAGRCRRALATRRRPNRYTMERELKEAARRHCWSGEQINSLLALLQ
jgi:hypothetical protein